MASKKGKAAAAGKRLATGTKNFFWRHSFGIALIIMALFIAGLAWMAHAYVTITGKFDSSRRWDLPSRIYSDATPILPGLAYPRELLEPKLNHLGYHEVDGRVSNPGEYRYVDGDLEIYLQNFRYPDMDFVGMPVKIDFASAEVKSVQRLGDDIPLRGVRIEPQLITSIYDDVMEDRVPVPLKEVPQSLIDAIITTEDRAFFRHEGISIKGILRAAITNLRRGETVAGGSTLTQQLVKNLYLTHARTMSRKVREALMAIILESRYDKNAILEAYLNEIYLGQNGSVQIVGVEQASQTYFGKHVSRLTLPESATIAAMIRSPNVYSPLKNPDRAKTRRNIVLKQMLETEKITEAQYAEAVEAPMEVTKFPRVINSAPYFVDLVMKELRETYPETQLETEGLRVFTTLDTMMQASAEEALDDGIKALSKRYSHVRNSKTPLEGAVLTIQPGTGYVKALVGGRDYGRSQFNRVIQARRQPGSLFKPFVYTAAMDPARGDQALTAATVLEDSPITVQTASGEWKPQNYDNAFHGAVTVRKALAHSYNIPAVRAAIDAGVPNVIRMASQIGVESPLKPYPSISLGAFEVTPLEIAYAYSVFANEGVKAEPVSILAVLTREGKLLESREVKMQRVAPASVSFVMNDILQDVLVYGTGARARSMGFRRDFAAKSGTTNDYRDAWFIGYSPRILSVVWVGFDDNKTTRMSGTTAALPIWTDHMKRVAPMVADVDFRRPDDVITREIDPETGLLSTSMCPEARAEFFVARTEPTESCYLHSGWDDRWYPFPGREDEGWRDRENRKKKKETGIDKILDWIFD